MVSSTTSDLIYDTSIVTPTQWVKVLEEVANKHKGLLLLMDGNGRRVGIVSDDSLTRDPSKIIIAMSAEHLTRLTYKILLNNKEENLKDCNEAGKKAWKYLSAIIQDEYKRKADVHDRVLDWSDGIIRVLELQAAVHDSSEESKVVKMISDRRICLDPSTHIGSQAFVLNMSSVDKITAWIKMGADLSRPLFGTTKPLIEVMSMYPAYTDIVKALKPKAPSE